MSDEPITDAGSSVAWAFYTRHSRRHAVDRPEQTYAELCHPSPGGAIYRLPLLNISLHGVSFLAPPELAEVSVGARLDELVLRVGLLEIRGEMTLCHVTAKPDGRNVCGGRFHPVRDSDRRKLDELIAAFESPDAP